MKLFGRLRMWVLSTLGYAVIRALGATLRLRTMHSEGVDVRWGNGSNSIISFWHGRQVMLPFAYRGSGVVILLSEHRDGELIARILGWFGAGAVRGSTTRGGIRALRQLVRAGRAGADLVVTPDGPRGPRCHAQAGVIELAKLTGLPIFPLTFAASKKKSLRAGIGLKSHCHLVTAASSGVLRYGSRARPTEIRLRRSVWSSKLR
jgi:lysophospholipid acyltransferase (LPLAT)-like uncharacterized protein